MLKIAIVVGETSGDRLGARLIAELKKQVPELEAEGVVGPELIDQGCTQLYSSGNLNVMGFVEPIFRLKTLYKMRSWLIKRWTQDPPDVFIGVDAPDFNMGIEKALHSAGILTVHYVSPSVWAWRRGRIKNIKKSVDLMLTLFPFEEKFYQDHHVPVKFIGHPVADEIAIEPDQLHARQVLELKNEDIVVAVLPGSRSQEIAHMMKIYLQTINICYQQNKSLKFVMPIVSDAYLEVINSMHEMYAPGVPLQVVEQNSYVVMAACDIALVTSGTATLELMLHKRPMVVAYKTNYLTYQIAKKLIKVDYISLPNLLANEALVPEVIQNEATPNRLSDELMKLINNKDSRDKQISKFTELHYQLRLNATKQASAAVMELLKEEEFC